MCRSGYISRVDDEIRGLLKKLVTAWIDAVEPVAYGLCGMSPAELWDTTPAELFAIVKARRPADHETPQQEKFVETIDSKLKAWAAMSRINV